MSNTTRVYLKMNRGIVIYDISVLVNDISVGVKCTYNIKTIRSINKSKE